MLSMIYTFEKRIIINENIEIMKNTYFYKLKQKPKD